MSRALVVGRFQPFHRGHAALIEQALAQHGDVVVAIGSSQAHHTQRDPFTAEERTEMIRAAFGESVDVAWVPDIFDPPNWVAHVQGIIGPVAVAYGNDAATLALFEDAGIPATRPGLVERAFWEGTTIRGLMASGDPAWQDAVPGPVVAVVEKIQGAQRLQALTRQHGRQDHH